MNKSVLKPFILDELAGHSRLYPYFYEESVWLTLEQIAELFYTSSEEVLNIINSIYEHEKLKGNEFSKSLSATTYINFFKSEKTQKHYNLDVILIVGYQLDIGIATRFRQWTDKELQKPQVQKSFLEIVRVYIVQIIVNALFLIGVMIALIYSTDASNKVTLAITSITFLMVLYNIAFDAIRYDKISKKGYY